VVTRRLLVVGTGGAGYAQRPGPRSEGPVVQGDVVDEG
jgi:hypothetical protein